MLFYPCFFILVFIQFSVLSLFFYLCFNPNFSFILVFLSSLFIQISVLSEAFYPCFLSSPQFFYLLRFYPTRFYPVIFIRVHFYPLFIFIRTVRMLVCTVKTVNKRFVARGSSKIYDFRPNLKVIVHTK